MLQKLELLAPPWVRALDDTPTISAKIVDVSEDATHLTITIVAAGGKVFTLTQEKKTCLQSL